jgi:hypothetical protein
MELPEIGKNKKKAGYLFDNPAVQSLVRSEK